MAISIQPVSNLFGTSSVSPLTPSTDLISQLAQTNLANQPDTEVIVTLGTGEPAILVYDANGILQEVLFDLAPPPSAVQTAAEELSVLTQTAIETALAEETGIVAATATPETTTTLFNPTVNLTQAQAANDLLFALAEANTATTVTPTEAAAAAAQLLVQNTAVTTEAVIAQGVIAATTANIPNPNLTSLEVANQNLINALAEAANANAVNNALANTDFNTLLAAVEAQTLLTTPAAPLGTTTTTATTTTAAIAAAEAATLNVTPAVTDQNTLATATAQALSTTTATETVQPFTTIPTTVTTNNLLQDLLTQAANQALATISSDPNYANSLAALLLSSTGARVRMVDETGALLNTPEPVGPIAAIRPTKAFG